VNAGESESIISAWKHAVNTESSGDPRQAHSAEFELRYLRQLRALASQLRTATDIAKVSRAALRAGMDLLQAAAGCVAVLAPDKEHVEFASVVGPADKKSWDRELLTSFIRGGEHRIPGDLALGRLRRRGRMWGVLALQSKGGQFNWSHREALSSLAALANEALDRIDQDKIRSVRARIDCKILEQLRPKDLFYQILHGLHSLIQYDHSATLLIYEPAGNSLEIAAETLPWKKGKSTKVGLKLPLAEPLMALLRPGVVYGFDRQANSWAEWTQTGALKLAELLDTNYVDAASGAAPLDKSMLCAPLVIRERVLGILKVAGKHAGFFGAYEAGLVEQFLPHVSVALENWRRTESLELNLIQAERKHAMANLARGVAHDVNNALGAVLPLVQQMRTELDAGNIDAAALADDLRQIESSIQTSRRIFRGMLSFARGSASSGANIKQAIDNTRTILKEGLQRRGIEVTAEVESELPSIDGSQTDLEQLFLNLLTNARDAMPQGGRLTITAQRSGSTLQLAVADTGVGIPPEHLPKVLEPFFSTKPDGNGLGLSICRSIVWQLQGKLEISSVLGEGTRVSVTIPISSRGES
jgi:signal transduction histidine kinase